MLFEPTGLDVSVLVDFTDADIVRVPVDVLVRGSLADCVTLREIRLDVVIERDTRGVCVYIADDDKLLEEDWVDCAVLFPDIIAEDVLVIDIERLCLAEPEYGLLPELEGLMEGDDEVVTLCRMLRVCVGLIVGLLVRIADTLVVELVVAVLEIVIVALPVRVPRDVFETDELVVDVLELVEERVELIDNVAVLVL